MKICPNGHLQDDGDYCVKCGGKLMEARTCFNGPVPPNSIGVIDNFGYLIIYHKDTITWINKSPTSPPEKRTRFNLFYETEIRLFDKNGLRRECTHEEVEKILHDPLNRAIDKGFNIKLETGPTKPDDKPTITIKTPC